MRERHGLLDYGMVFTCAHIPLVDYGDDWFIWPPGFMTALMEATWA